MTFTILLTSCYNSFMDCQRLLRALYEHLRVFYKIIRMLYDLRMVQKLQNWKVSSSCYKDVEEVRTLHI